MASDVLVFRLPSSSAEDEMIAAPTFLKSVTVESPTDVGNTMSKLPPTFWDTVGISWRFNESSSVFFAYSIGELLSAMAETANSPASWIVQAYQGAIIISSMEDSSAPESSYHIFKCTWPHNRILSILPGPLITKASTNAKLLASRAYLDSTTDTKRAIALFSLLAMGITETDDKKDVTTESLKAPKFPVLVHRLRTLLDWLRKSVKDTHPTSQLWRLDFSPSSRQFALSALDKTKVTSPLKSVPNALASAEMPPLVKEATIAKIYASPAVQPTVSGHKRPREAGDTAEAARDAVMSEAAGVSLAVIVPFRDQPLQNRGLQLQKFCEFMPKYLASVVPPLTNFHIFIIEQSDDGYKFNRGKTLNIGFHIASDPALLHKFGIRGSFNAFCFHDVDLFPTEKLAPFYAKFPATPIHIASAWPRYTSMPHYVGGVLTLSAKDFKAINGFPNNMWGWGGEDDVLSERLKSKHITPERMDPSLKDAIVDMEEELIKTKGGVRATAKASEGGKQEWKCFWKRELAAFHKETNHYEGLSTLRYNVLATTKINDRATKITVDLFARNDPATEKLERIECNLTASADTVSTYVTMLKDAYDKLKAGTSEPAVAAPVGQRVIAALTKPK